MKKIIIIISILFINFSVAQCENYGQLLTAGLSKILFFDADNGFAFGQGTLIKTNDGGINWTFVEIPNNNIYTETLKYCDKIDENSAIIVGQNGNIIKTINKGQTWSSLSLMIDGLENINCVDFIDSNIGYATANTNSPQQSYLMKTTDGGLTWIKILIGFHYALNSYLNFYDNIRIHFLDEMNGFAWDGNYFFKTIDGGVTWIQLQNPDVTNPNPINTMKIAENNDIVVSLFYSNYLYVSSDSGNSWILISDLSPSNNISIDGSAFEIKNNKVEVIASTGLTVEKSFITYDLTNNSFTNNPINSNIGLVSDIFFTNSLNGFIIDRGNFYWADTPGRKILKTTDGGVNWNELDSFSLINPGGYQNNINVLINSPDTLTLTKQDNYNGSNSDFNLYTSVNNGVTWQQKLDVSGVNAFLLKATNNYISYLRYTNPTNGADGLSLYESYDLGETWTHSEFQGPINIIQESYVQLDFNTLRCGLNNQMFLSLDKGQTWSEIQMPTIPNITFNDAKIKNVNEIYAWGEYDNWPTNYDYYLYKTVNQGQTWQLVVTIPDNNGADLGVNADTTIFGSDYAFVSTGGNTYFIVNLNNNTYTSIPFINPIPNQVYVSSDGLKILNDTTWLMNATNGYKISTNQGQTWTTKKCLVCSNKIIYDNLTNDLITYNNDHGVERLKGYDLPTPIIYGNAIVEINQSGNYFVPYNSLSNPSWGTISGGTLTTINDNYIQINWTQIGEHIVKVKYINSCGETNFYEFTVTVISQLATDSYDINNLSVFPNPFNNDLKIQNLKNPISEIEIYNITGQLVFSKKYNTQIIDITNLGNLNSRSLTTNTI